jgi:uncharacterized protein RhaS with RHS repeats
VCASYGDQELTEYAGTVGQPISWTKRFIYGPGLDEPVASYDPAGVLLYQFADVQGSVIAQINTAGQVTEKHGYAAYGLSNSLGTNTASYQYAGRRLDQDTGLYYNRARYYAPSRRRVDGRLQHHTATLITGLSDASGLRRNRLSC